MGSGYDGGRLLYPSYAFWTGNELFYKGKPFWACTENELMGLVWRLDQDLRNLVRIHKNADDARDKLDEEYHAGMNDLFQQLADLVRDAQAETVELRKEIKELRNE